MPKKSTLYNFAYNMPSGKKYCLKSNIFAMHNPSLIHENMLYYTLSKRYSAFHVYVCGIIYFFIPYFKILAKIFTIGITFSSPFFLRYLYSITSFLQFSLVSYYRYHILLLIYSCNPYSRYTLNSRYTRPLSKLVKVVQNYC